MEVKLNDFPYSEELNLSEPFDESRSKVEDADDDGLENNENF